MRYDPFLEKKFAVICNKLARTIIKDDSEDISDALEIIRDEKVINHQHQRVLHNLDKLKTILVSQNKGIPVELKYREASIYYELDKDYEKSEKIFLEIINTNVKDNWVNDRAKFYLIKIYMNQFSSIDDHEAEVSEENLEKAEKLLNSLQTKSYNKTPKLDDYVQGELWQLKKTFEYLQKNKKLTLLSYPDKISKNYITREEVEIRLNEFDLFIDLINMNSFIRGQLQAFPEKDLKLLVFMARGCNLDECKELIETENEDTAYQRISRLRKKLIKLDLPTFKNRYKFQPSVKIGIFYNRFENQDLLYSLYLL